MGELSKKFIVPPFSVLDTKQHYWMERKRNWISLGIESEVGRTATSNPIEPDYWWEKYGREPMSGTSIFDPVLCELMYEWFCPKNGKVLDPFAGGSVRGIIAAKLGRAYTGIELRNEQVEANRVQAQKIFDGGGQPVWLVGDSEAVLGTDEAIYDMVFTCPPYHDLEIYSEDPGDLSNMPYSQFLEKFERIISLSISRLRINSFFVIVVGDVRDENGYYKNFPEDTVKIFERQGLKKYNEIIVLKPTGTLPFRVGRQFSENRKVGKAHENVYVFYKGDVNEIRNNYGVVNEEMQGQRTIWSGF